MYLCFEADDKRATFPEASLISVDENGFTMKGSNPRTGNTVFLKLNSFQGAVERFSQAMQWVKRAQPKKQAKPPEKLPNNPTF